MYGFEVDFNLDDAGVATWFAWQAENIDDEGIPLKGSLVGKGETPHQAIANLCEKIDEAVEEAAQQAHARELENSAVVEATKPDK